MRLTILAETLSICRLAPEEPLPAWANGAFSAVVRTWRELSIVCAAACVPAEVHQEAGWRAFEVQGPLDFSLIGIVAGLAVPLAAARISIFVVSAFDTDYVLVREERLADAVAALKTAGHEFP